MSVLTHCRSHYNLAGKPIPHHVEPHAKRIVRKEKYRSRSSGATLFAIYLPYFFGYKTEFFVFQNNPDTLDSLCKMDLDLWDCLGRIKLIL